MMEHSANRAINIIRGMDDVPCERRLAGAVIAAAIEDARGGQRVKRPWRYYSAIEFLDGKGLSDLWFGLITPFDRDPVQVREAAKMLAIEGRADDCR